MFLGITPMLAQIPLSPIWLINRFQLSVKSAISSAFIMITGFGCVSFAIKSFLRGSSSIIINFFLQEAKESNERIKTTYLRCQHFFCILVLNLRESTNFVETIMNNF